MANVSSVQQLSTKVKRQEVLSAVAWHSFLIVMLWIGGLATLGWLVWLGYYWGSSGCYTCTQNKPVPVAVVATPSSTQTTETATLTEIEKDLSAIGRILLEQKEITQAFASATASVTTAVVVPSLPKAERRVVSPVTKQAEPVGGACPCPSPANVPKLDQGSAPIPTLSSAERRRNEMWSALRR